MIKEERPKMSRLMNVRVPENIYERLVEEAMLVGSTPSQVIRESVIKELAARKKSREASK